MVSMRSAMWTVCTVTVMALVVAACTPTGIQMQTPESQSSVAQSPTSDLVASRVAATIRADEIDQSVAATVLPDGG
jgi:hypothetical protein